MVNGYRLAARSAKELGLRPLAPLNEAIPELVELQAAGDSIASGQRRPKVAGAEKRHDSQLVHEEGVEPSRLAAPEPKSGASASSATRARDWDPFRDRFTCLPVRGPPGPEGSISPTPSSARDRAPSSRKRASSASVPCRRDRIAEWRRPLVRTPPLLPTLSLWRNTP
jgi:hypothetical protein